MSDTEVLAAIDWFDDPVFDPKELLPALQEALEHHWAIRGQLDLEP
ncbi:MAG: hypothetical protein IPM18_12780 [Phycisphaerales bacterium]|nr:hypothetical protein [Phycisphaerales bacterium]